MLPRKALCRLCAINALRFRYVLSWFAHYLDVSGVSSALAVPIQDRYGFVSFLDIKSEPQLRTMQKSLFEALSEWFLKALNPTYLSGQC